MIRTRVAPSPTGDPHLGTAYSALMNYCFARRHGGAFILRIEDTDQARSTSESERKILETLRWLGLDWDEGPDIGGRHGPYRQSERGHIYRPYVDQLLAEGHAFRCFCSVDRLAEMRAGQTARGEPVAYDGQCLALKPSESARRAENGETHVVRLKTPTEGDCVVWDMRRGPVTIGWSNIDMQVLVKSDGLPTYHLANVIDDHLMGITHVLRGEEWLPSAPKHLLLYDYFGWVPPKLCHLPLLRNPDKTKLSKRKNQTSIDFYRRSGYLPEAVVNMLGLYSLSMAEGSEIRTLQQIVFDFDIDNVSIAGPVFDVGKLSWLNAHHLRECLTAEEFARRVLEWCKPVLPALELARSRIEKFSDLGEMLGFLLSDGVPFGPVEIAELKIDALVARQALHLALWRLDNLDRWSAQPIEKELRLLADRLGLRFRDFIKLFYLAITGRARSIPVIQSMQILGRDMTRKRLRHALAALGGATASEAAAWREHLFPASPIHCHFKETACVLPT